MTFSSDQNLNYEKLSTTSRRMLELREKVFSAWEERVRASIKEAQGLQQPVLINTFPALYDNIAEAISPDYPRASGIANSTIAIEHGGERARLTNYSPQAIISEYQILRWTLLEVLKKNRLQLNDDEFLAINTSIDGAITEAVTAFALTQSALRERFVAALSHDLRNPLASANMAAEMILRITDSTQIENLVNKILQNNQRMDGMIQDLLDTMLFQSGERLRLTLSDFDILELVSEVCEQAQIIHGPRFEIFGSPLTCWWGRDAIKRALENLVGNAVKYGTPDTPIRIKIDAMHGRVLLTVHNEGNPIPPEHLENVFQVFRRAEAAKEGKIQGWGIGLPYVRSVAESHGGSIGVDSSTERGTTFLIDLPIDARPFQNAPTLGQAH